MKIKTFLWLWHKYINTSILKKDLYLFNSCIQHKWTTLSQVNENMKSSITFYEKKTVLWLWHLCIFLLCLKSRFQLPQSSLDGSNPLLVQFFLTVHCSYGAFQHLTVRIWLDDEADGILFFAFLISLLQRRWRQAFWANDTQRKNEQQRNKHLFALFLLIFLASDFDSRFSCHWPNC